MTQPVALITGASSGFGLATAKRLLMRGFRVIASARRQDKLAALAEKYPSQVLPLALDVRDRAAIRSAITELPTDWADIEVLVNNAGLALGLAPAQAANLDDWHTMIDTNCLGLAAITHAVLPGMVARNRGLIVNIGSIAGDYAYPGGNVYGATKAFVHQFSLNLKADLLGTAVRVSCLEPGLAGGSEFSKVRFQGDDAKAASVYQGTQPLMPEDIASVVEWLATLPPHININVLEMMPVCQAPSALAIHRKS
ncbi:SDR family NAD(P)-dependent oxidoreductase [Chitinimonas sp. BJB300]|uniref:SDR family NAD(P)-dependent oxidoreductase n=1 Tax=Chitinimonas sp. BJB300 TaxID=1559339 RepID=UPI000C0E7711|nr:SDR family NAD(P)-dependent oxidoreductase [Chitinimonas sp. BJB300]PHV10303.1 NADP-dependent 3-hydroxy acid dehydrogenase [Chitinimonas sp. BJB300]TSJ90809.1 SDR family NAD(P)-dependent oxidoreductase [Chitinimonas sp. BJB300]